MKTGASSFPSLIGGAVLALALSACAIPVAQQAPAALSAPCADSTYVQLKQQHPDSLSDRSWQRLESLDRECKAAQSHSHGNASREGGRGHGHGGLFGMGIFAALMMAAMTISMW